MWSARDYTVLMFQFGIDYSRSLTGLRNEAIEYLMGKKELSFDGAK